MSFVQAHASRTGRGTLPKLPRPSIFSSVYRPNAGCTSSDLTSATSEFNWQVAPHRYLGLSRPPALRFARARDAPGCPTGDVMCWAGGRSLRRPPRRRPPPPGAPPRRCGRPTRTGGSAAWPSGRSGWCCADAQRGWPRSSRPTSGARGLRAPSRWCIGPAGTARTEDGTWPRSLRLASPSPSTKQG